jgi:hypothetical protein
MSFHLRGKYKFWLLGAVALGLVAVVVVLLANHKQPSSKNTADDARQQYAALYDAAWRSDGVERSNMVVTATLLVPPAVEALGRDTGRSGTEEQYWRIVEPLDASMIPVVVTFDSVSGAVTDEVIQNGLLLFTPRATLSFEEWKPIIAPSRVVNAPSSVTSQIGIAIFRAAKPIDWNTLGSLTLTVSGIAGQADRTFNWSEPKILLQL